MTHSHLESALTLKHFCTRDRSSLIAESSRGSARHRKCPRNLLSASLRAFWTKLMKWKARLLSAEELPELPWDLPEQVPCLSSTVQMPLSWWTKETKPCIFEFYESASKAWKPRSYSTAFTYINTIFSTQIMPSNKSSNLCLKTAFKSKFPLIFHSRVHLGCSS